SIVLVEFKRPGRDDYKYGDVKKDPIEQVKATAIKIRDEERIITKTGKAISVFEGVRLYAYIVADLEPTLTKVCKNHDMKKTWDSKGYYMYHTTNDIFVETVSYDKLISDAQKRNAAFFNILLGDVVA
ncbi:MAG: ATP-binding protein, partial [Alphaproteobacteria bacterium]|nr:ATP-binding protein [Alphaproteobacteria bacterium]